MILYKFKTGRNRLQDRQNKHGAKTLCLQYYIFTKDEKGHLKNKSRYNELIIMLLREKSS